jgi:hypothetical protein
MNVSQNRVTEFAIFCNLIGSDEIRKKVSFDGECGEISPCPKYIPNIILKTSSKNHHTQTALFSLPTSSSPFDSTFAIQKGL